ncbi:MAG TPA: ATP-binding protein, partial [Anaeromyxobacteraceae bacterium]
MVVIGGMSHLHADGHPAYVRLMTHRRRAAAVAAGLVAAFVPLDLAQEVGSSAAVVLRILWVALLAAAIAAQRPDSPRLSAAAARLICFLSGVILVAIVAVTGGADGIYFHFLLALPLGAMVVAPDLPSGAALTALVTTSGGAALLLRDGHPALHVVSWVLMSVAAGTLSLWGTILYARSWAAEVASERARARAAEELARSERRRAAAERLATVGRLAAGIAHEINNPLAYVKGNVEWLAESLPEGRCTAEQAREVLADTGGGVEHIARVVADLQAFARDDREVPGPCAVQELVDAALRLGSTRLRDVPDIRLEVEPGLPSVHAHARRIAQAVLNLVVNAADALEGAPQEAGRGPEIRVRARGSGDSVVIEVEDSGPGLSPEAAAHLFEPFFTTKGERGTGLGLALSRE